MKKCLLLLFAFSFCIASSSEAAVIMQLGTFDGAAPESNFDIGDTVTVRLFAIDDTGALPDFTEELRGFQVRLGATGTAVSAVDTAIGTESVGAGLTPPPVSLGAYSTGDRLIAGNVAAATGVLVTSPFQLAEFSFNVGASDVGSTNLFFNTTLDVNNTITFRPGPASGYSVGGGQLTLTPTSFTVNAAAVPEPSSLAFVACGLGGLIYRRRQSKRALK